MGAKKLNENSFGKQKLGKTKGRRRALGSERRLADSVAAVRRNDLTPELELKNLPVSELCPSLHRTRRTKPEQLERVLRSIAAYGVCKPVLVTGTEIIDGHVVVEAAARLGLATLPVIDCQHLSDIEVRQLRLAINRTGELGEWDLELLRIELEALVDLDAGLLATGFTTEEMDIILLDEQPASDDDGQEEAAPEKPVSRLGDVWILRGHRVACRDALEEAVYDAVLRGEKAHLALSDLPYNVPIKNNVSGLGKKVHDEFVMASGELDAAGWQTFLDTAVARAAENVVPGSALLMFMDWRSIDRLYAAGYAAGLCLKNLLVWYKEGSAGMGANWRSSHELVAAFCKGATFHTNNIELGRHGRDRANVWAYAGANRRGSSANEMLAHHATPKPVELCEDAILDVSERGHLVLDAFLGSGTTLIAAERTGRLCRGIELNPAFVDLAIVRWSKLTGGQALLEATGQAFSEVAEQRLADADAELGSAEA